MEVDVAVHQSLTMICAFVRKISFSDGDVLLHDTAHTHTHA